REDDEVYTPVLTWKQVQRKLPWGVIILLGGGFALARGVAVSGLSHWLADKLSSLDYLDKWVLNLVLCLIVAAATEVTSNTATATLLMPIMANLVRAQFCRIWHLASIIYRYANFFVCHFRDTLSDFFEISLRCRDINRATK
ncbi:solute carrier family 13 member 2, partial [Plakobranchus ocellatus]